MNGLLWLAIHVKIKGYNYTFVPAVSSQGAPIDCSINTGLANTAPKRRPPSPLLRLVYANPPHPTVSSAYPLTPQQEPQHPKHTVALFVELRQAKVVNVTLLTEPRSGDSEGIHLLDNLQNLTLLAATS
ncbi:hypothetical protein VOLCADRAFT_89094 [Volvox carteri f. nagariensis]|uniref:Uncharacterized protein n=1 Tax=Volvox carteri f. nagariensis TaxID=3068 RepID=D8TQS5_VOLCA|nr:uncharacterized protein VOLCADRAFT_89094 [Volvox carteri f. nagariensis]EFJ50206.1 hypothetical protein VOLCADRAFT_89094 [Volvox carteri f. nagariensis]|eukprot:XP_002948826.1 hypothetical protein VOLCADRAFT_89094 [Volvox carteri f. nagariensis]